MNPIKNTLDLWELNENDQLLLTKKRLFCRWIEFLVFASECNGLTRWVENNEEQALKCFSLLKRMKDRSGNSFSRKILSIDKRISEVYLDLFRSLNLLKEKKTINSMPKNFESLTLFNQEIDSPEKKKIERKERKSRKVVVVGDKEFVLDGGEYNRFMMDKVNSLINCLKSEKIDNKKLLNNYNNILPLEKNYIEFLYQNLEPETVFSLLVLGESVNNPDLIWVCLVFMSKNKELLEKKIKSLERLQIKKIGNQEKNKNCLNLLNATQQLLKAGMILAFSETFCRIVKINYEITQETKKALGEMNQILKINGLHFESSSIKYLDLTDVLPIIDELEVHSRLISDIPSKWQNCLKKLNCEKCYKLTSINTPEATKIICKGCSELTSLIATNVIEVDCTDCKKLPSLDVPNAIKIICQGCSELTSLIATNARKIVCRYCLKLPGLDAPNAIKIICSHCPELESLIAPKATDVASAYSLKLRIRKTGVVTFFL